MAEVKMTKKDMYNKVIALAKDADRQDIVDFAKHEIELLGKRNASDSKAKQKKAAENAALGEKIVEFLAGVSEATPTLEIATAVGISTQKASPILKALEADGRIKVSEDKRKKFYSLAE